MTRLTEHLKGVGSGPTNSAALTSTPPKTEVYKDTNGLIRVAGSGVVIAGYPEVLEGTTLITEPDRGKTG